MQTQKKSQLKLPHIKKTHKQSVNLLSKTISDTNYTPKVRPASSNKVQDLQKKLFNKLQAYETGGKKKLSKKISRIVKQPSMEVSTNVQAQQGYERMQKIMPALYSKLVENKKGTIQSEHLINQFDISTSQKSVPIIRKQTEHSESKYEQKEQAGREEDDYQMSQQQLDRVFKSYQLLEGLTPSTTKQNMIELNQSIVNCEKDIEQLKKSMQGLIQQIGLQFINQLQIDQYQSSK